MSNTPSVINSIVQFQNGSQAAWNSIAVPIPIGMVVYATDTGAVKMGDGVTLYANLPTLFNVNDVIQFMTLLAGKAPLVHTHTISDITNYMAPERLIFESTIAPDGLSIRLPWTIDTPIAVDVFVNGGIQQTSSLTLVNGNIIQIANAVAPRTPVRVVWYIQKDSAAQVSEISQLTVSSDSWSSNPNTGVITITLSNGQTITITGNILFQGLPPSTWETGGTLPTPAFEFVNIGPANWLAGGPGIPAGMILIQGLGPSTWLGTSNISHGNTLFNSLGAGSFLPNGAGIISGEYIFASYGFAKWDTGASAFGSSDTIFSSLGPSSFT